MGEPYLCPPMIQSIHIRPVRRADSRAWLLMRHALWPDESDSHVADVAAFLDGEITMPLEVLMAFDENGEAIGFAELSIRSYAEDCYSGRVAYLEGWFVDAAARRQGVGAALVDAAEEWGRAQGCTEFASDALIDNEMSLDAHRALGFTETARLVCFRKDL
jgi:aminoglycoside 6'-N-acetyltransferase I